MGWLDHAERSLAKADLPSLEHLFCSPDYFGIEDATPLQRAICRIVEGRPLGSLAEHPHVRLAVGDVSSLPRVAPSVAVLCAAVRGGKSALAAAGGWSAAMRCPDEGFTPGERPRVPIVSVHKDQAQPTLDHLVGALENRPRMRDSVILPMTADTVALRHPSGREVEIKVTAGARAGATLAARWLAACTFDEAPRMVGVDAGIVNLDDMLRTVEARMLGPIWLVGSPWAPFGPVYDLVQEHHGRPTPECVVIRARGDWLNPRYWTPERQAQLQRRNPTAYRTDFEADFADPAEALIPSATIEACTRAEPIEVPPHPLHTYTAAIDPASRSNAFTLVVATREGKRVRVVLARQWKPLPGHPLKLDEVLGHIAALLRPYRVTSIDSDDWSGDALVALARAVGLTLVPWADGAADVSEMYLELSRRMALGEVELPPDGEMRSDLVRCQRAVTQAGVTVHLPKTRDGRHCDYVPALARVVRAYLPDVRPEVGKADAEQAAVLAKLQERWKQRKSVPIWKRGYR
jgi:hypothetical protein